MNLFPSLRREQKEAIFLLQAGTFLEYFDLMLYVHMAVLLNELFFPKTDPHTASLLMAVAFCSTFIMRPVGALIFGWIGDHIGRKTTVIFTTMMMAVSCLIMANLPTYEQIGIAAAWAVTICRMIQGMSSLGEIIGAEIYITETTKPPVRYQAIGMTVVSSGVGGMVALAVASVVTSYGLNWRLAFWWGAGIALVGTFARTRLRETPDFIDMKRRIKKVITEAEENGLDRAADRLKKTSLFWKEKIDKKTALAYFLIACGWPVSFYFSYVHCGSILKNSFGYTAEQIIHQNFTVSIFQLLGFIWFAALCHRIHPLKLLKVRLFVFMVAALLCPLILYGINTPLSLLVIQSTTMFCSLSPGPAAAVFLIHFPIFKRFTAYSFLFAFSRVLMYVVTSFGLVYLTEFFGHYGLLLIMIPVIVGFYWGVRHFEKLETLAESREKHGKDPISVNPYEKVRARS